MSVKFYCDVCGDEIPLEQAGKRLNTTWKNVQTHIVAAIDGTWNGGHICQDCLMRAVNEGEQEYRT